MSVANPAFHIAREPLFRSEGIWTKMFDPPRLGPPTPELLDLTNLPPANPPWGVKANPVPSVMAAAGMYNPNQPFLVMRSLMHGVTRATWDNAQPGRPSQLVWFMFADDFLTGPKIVDPLSLVGALQNPSEPIYPGPTLRVPRGAIFHSDTACQGPPPHTIHWHGIEPTPMNDGVGHCSFEVEGHYIYQWQPSFIGTYFYHCHRNTMMHFEYGLAGFMLFDPPDAYFASIATLDPVTGVATLNNIPIGNGRPEVGFPLGRRRTAANLNFSGLPSFPGFVGGNPIQGPATPDPEGQFQFDPHAFTVPYDVEVLWFLDDRSSEWSEGMPDPFGTFPVGANIGGNNVFIGFNEGFHNKGKSLTPEPGGAFFGFNDFNADYWFVTGVPVQAHTGGSYTLPTNLIYPAVLNGGISGARIDIAASKGQTIFIRCLDGAYNSTRVTFPMDVVVIEWDGRALGVPPLARYNRPILIKAGTPLVHSTARRWGAIANVPVTAPSVNTPVKVEFLDTRSTNPLSLTGGGDVLMTTFIPCHIN